MTGNSLIAGFSVWGLMGGLLFGGVGFVSFMYGKKTAKFRLMIFGVLLMGYPYFIHGTIAVYLTGIALTAGSYLFRE